MTSQLSSELVLTRQEAADWDHYSIVEGGIDSKLLMAWAAQSIARAIFDRQLFIKDQPVLLLAGSGNNGGDAYALAWLLYSEYGCTVHTFYSKPPQTADAAYFFKLLLKHEPTSKKIVLFSSLSKALALGPAIIIDGLLGIGFQGALRKKLEQYIRQVNSVKAVRIAIDIASGIPASGEAFTHEAFRADLTLAVGAHKVGSLTEPGCFFSGENIVVPIGFVPMSLPERRVAVWKSVPSLRKPAGHKYTSGSAVFFGGSAGMEGALILAVRSFLNLGGGLARLCGDSYEFKAGFLQALPEAQVNVSDDVARTFLEIFQDAKTSCGVMGMGLASDPGEKFWRSLLQTEDKILLIDGGGLRFLAKYTSLLQNHKLKAVILTPHAGEWNALLGQKPANIFDSLSQFAERHNSFLVAKGPGLFVTARHGLATFFKQQEFSLATGGTGDILNGVLANYLLRSLEPMHALEQGLELYLKAAAKARGQNMETLLPTDLVEKLKELHSAVL